jgi:hypothetical protein
MKSSCNSLTGRKSTYNKNGEIFHRVRERRAAGGGKLRVSVRPSNLQLVSITLQL